ncbi:MAG: DNA repair protein RecN [Candidatus Velthaea sp.]
MRFLRLTIDDFGLIAHAECAFADGLTVFSGETGSGKTMLLGALQFVLGERADSDMIRSGADGAAVALELEPDAELGAALEGAGIGVEAGDDVVIARRLLAGGRSQARINGTPVTAGQLRELGRRLVDFVGQHEAQRLLAPSFALEALDRFGGDDLRQLRDGVRALHGDLHAARTELSALRDDEGRAAARLEFARFAAAEIDVAALEDGEDERLRERRDVLANAEKIAAALAAANAALESDGGAVDTLGRAAEAAGHIARYGEVYASLAASIAALQSEATDAAVRLARECDAVEADPAALESILARLDALERLKKKYGGSLAAVRETRAEFAAAIERDGGRDERIAALEKRTHDVDAALRERAARLTRARAAAARTLERSVGAELRALAMAAATFRVAFEALAEVGAAGAERAEFRLSANPGEPERPLARGASGGELSRVLLALIVVLADRRERTALVFDEIDAGIGGATAAAAGVRLGRLARETQVVVVTHLAQIASWADAHYALRKHERARSTTVALEGLHGADARLAEIARMLSGDATAVSLEHAATLVAGARRA